MSWTLRSAEAAEGLGRIRPLQRPGDRAAGTGGAAGCTAEPEGVDGEWGSADECMGCNTAARCALQSLKAWMSLKTWTMSGAVLLIWPGKQHGCTMCTSVLKQGQAVLKHSTVCHAETHDWILAPMKMVNVICYDRLLKGVIQAPWTWLLCSADCYSDDASDSLCPSLE
eukprot:scaffold54398_cov24-Tisochrysis_lutea.AAC.1